MIRESQVEKEIVSYAKATGWWVSKFTAPGKRAVPDRIFIRKGFVLFMEIKRPGEVPSRQQFLRIEEMKRYGAIATWVDSVKAAKEWLDLF